MARAAGIAATLMAFAIPVAGHAASDPCAVSWTDVKGDTTYGLVLAVPIADRDLDVVKVTVRATATRLVQTVTVDRMNPAGPDYGTGHGASLYFTKYGKALSFAARRDATYGDRTYATGDGATKTPVELKADAGTNTFTLSVSRTDVARLSGTSSVGGVLTGLGASTLRSDHVAGAGEMTGAPGVGTSADSALVNGKTLSLDACDAYLRRTAKPAARSGTRLTVTDGFTFSGPAGSQAVVRFARPVGPPGVLQQGPPVSLGASKGDLAGLAILGDKSYVTAIRALPRFVCGKDDCGEGYATDADTNVAQGAKLAPGEYLLVLIGSPGATVTATVAPASGNAKPVRVTATAVTKIEVVPTDDTSGTSGAQQQAQGSWTRMQTHHRALAGVVHVAAIQYGGSVSYTLAAPGHARAGSVALKNAKPGPVPLGWAWTSMYTTHTAFGESTEVEATLTPSWTGRVDGAQASQHGLAVYVPLIQPNG